MKDTPKKRTSTCILLIAILYNKFKKNKLKQNESITHM